MREAKLLNYSNGMNFTCKFLPRAFRDVKNC